LLTSALVVGMGISASIFSATGSIRLIGIALPTNGVR